MIDENGINYLDAHLYFWPCDVCQYRFYDQLMDYIECTKNGNPQIDGSCIWEGIKHKNEYEYDRR